jgi:hypothetical protein
VEKTFKRVKPNGSSNQSILLDNPAFADMYGVLDSPMTLHGWSGALRNRYKNYGVAHTMPSEHTFGWRALRLVQEGLVEMSKYEPCDCRVCQED